MSFRPLQTGGSQVQSTSGAGTWLSAITGTAAAGLSAYQAASNANNSSDSSVPNGNDANGMTSYATAPGEEGQFSGGTGTGAPMDMPSQDDAMGWGGNVAPGDMGAITDGDFNVGMPDDGTDNDNGGW
jgi:hypothetical protein